HPAAPALCSLSLHDALPIFGAARHDRGIRRKLRAAAPELVQQLRFDLVLHASGARRLHGAAMRGGGDAPGAAHGRELVLVLDQADRKSTRLNSSHLGISYAV